MSAPQIAAVGADASRTVTAELSDTRELVRIEVGSRWELCFPPEELGARIFAAYSDGLSLLPQISYADMLSRISDGEQNLDTKLREFDGPPRSVASYTEAAQNAMDQAVKLLVDLREASVAVYGPMQTDVKTVVFRFNGIWLSSCQVNAGWAAKRSGPEITAEITDVLTRAKNDTGGQEVLAGVQEQIGKAVGVLLTLGNEAIAALRYRTQSDTDEEAIK